MNNQSLWWVLGLLVGLWSCEIEIDEPYDFDATKAADIQEINEVIANNGWPAPDTTLSGARYIIFEGRDTTDATPQQEDIVYFDYTGFLLNGTVFDTTVPAVADTAFTETGDIVFEPVVYTFSDTGWTLRYVPIVSQYLTSVTPSTAFQEAITEAFLRMSPGDKVIILLPSTEVATLNRPIVNTVPIYYEISLVSIGLE
jgi:hypothetical protein